MLREKDFITEVHSINGEGEDEGVVYSEMESAQNTYEDIISRKVASLLYGTSAYISTLPCSSTPSPHSAYFGGDIANIRELTIDKIRRYHHKYYRPDNACMVIGGKWDEEQGSKLLRVMSSVESEISSSQQRTPYERPWTSGEGMDTSHIDNTHPVTSLKSFHAQIAVTFPSTEESGNNAHVTISSKTVPIEDFEKRTRLELLLEFRWIVLSIAAI